MEQPILFISDVHLSADRPAISRQFSRFLQQQRGRCRLYILGDLFDYWAGDDTISSPQWAETIAMLADFTSVTPTFFMHGNRDFLIGRGFAQATGITLLSDPCLMTLAGQRVLLSHGDALCTDDIAYQEFRTQVRNPLWQQQFLGQPLDVRLAQIADIRQRSDHDKAQKSESIMDVNEVAVHQLFEAYGYPPILIHGHTHRPARHDYDWLGHHCERYVLADWYERGSYLQAFDGRLLVKQVSGAS